MAAQAMLGIDLVFGDLRARIVETEAYANDPGSHAFRGMTPRTEVMFGPPGFAYVYFTYGNHWMLNITAKPARQPGAILIRAARPLDGIEIMFARRERAKKLEDLLSGPGKLAQAFAINRAQYGLDLLSLASPLRLEPGARPREVVSGVRVGLTPGKGDELPWRYMDADQFDFISRPKPKVS